MALSSSQQHLAVGPTCFPLAKFSHATVSGDLVKPIPWIHLSDKGHLHAVFEEDSRPSQLDNANGNTQLKILADPEVLVR